MTEIINTKNHRIPEKASDLIELALADLAKARRSKKYQINMGVWHTPEEDKTCTVCLAGSVMAYSLDVAATANISPLDIENNDPHTAGRLLALNEFRTGWIEEGLKHMRIYPLKEETLRYEAVRIRNSWIYYETNTVGWHKCMREVVKLLRKHDL